MKKFFSKFNRVGLKLSLLTCTLILLVIGVMARLMLDQARKSLVFEMEIRTHSLARLCREALFPKLDVFSLHFHVQEFIKEKAVHHLSVMNASGKILSHSNPSLIGDLDRTPEGKKALTSEKIFWQKYKDRGKIPGKSKVRDSSSEEFSELVVPLQVGKQRIGTIRAGFSKESINRALWNTKKMILWLSVGAMLIAVLGTILIVRWIMRPIPILAKAAYEIGQGNLQVKVDWKGKDEIGLLAKAFNEMAFKNAQLFDSLKQEKEKLETVFSEMKEGAIWAGPEGNIIYMNPPAKQLLGYQKSAPESLENAFEGFEAQPKINEILAQKERWLSCDFVRKDNKYYVLGGTSGRLEVDSNAQGFLLVFRDVTEDRREEMFKRSFLSLISHKLRTPLTTILGYLGIAVQSKIKNESLERGMKTSLKQANKLKHHVDKLLTFVSAQDPLAVIKSTPLKVLLQETLKEMEPFIQENAVLVQSDPKSWETIPPLNLNLWSMKEVLKNLLENAVKFNAEKEKKVTLRVAMENSDVRITIEDNGQGIPPEEQARLFTKFYQVEESFTGQVDGLGLGLAFAKNVIDRHGGQIGIQSKVKQGSTVSITLPLK